MPGRGLLFGRFLQETQRVRNTRTNITRQIARYEVEA
jgi:hypothetical protein